MVSAMASFSFKAGMMTEIIPGVSQLAPTSPACARQKHRS
jgi:hypothetical protein